MSVELNKEVVKETSTKKSDSSKPKAIDAQAKARYESEMKKDLKIVTGRFRNHELNGGSIKFIFHRYKDVGTQKFEFLDGQVYSVPYMVAEHINNNCCYTVHEHYMNEENKVKMRVGSKVQRFSFVPLGFAEETSLPVSSIVTVERV